MTKFRDFEPGDPVPAHVLDALQEYLQGSSANFSIRIKPGTATTLQIPASTDDARVAIAISSRWRYATANVEAAGSGAARLVDVWVTASENASHSDAGPPLHEVDDTVYSFALAIAETGVPPAGVDLSRRVAVARWNGSKFTAVDRILGGVVQQGERWVPGDLKATARAAADDGWLLCDGSAISRSTYAALFDALGTTYGVGDGSTTFNVPDLRGRVPAGVDGAAGRLTANDALGNAGGEEQHALVTSEMPAHVHDFAGEVAVATSPGAIASSTYATGGNTYVPYNAVGWGGYTDTNSEGGDGAHNNMPPYLIVNWLIKI